MIGMIQVVVRRPSSHAPPPPLNLRAMLLLHFFANLATIIM
eukprot:CAMPEP_0184497390 /NCGR_PEP_ID=MMETSP0113_2-20130426/36423_1 /TAXON_ID=91329 /ORGANISM="Norrisiella sphaerica, Strain BC52" /LENGTH=40 /DNA_ID= /DNA_START= /DNA_END= /DNA_ORIENTATION=